MIKIAHESPISIMNKVASLTDYDYALVHLFEEQPKYLEYFMSVIGKRETILDNSIFELGEAFDAQKFVYWINETHPTWYIIPDVFYDSKATIEQVQLWNDMYKPFISTNSLSIGVCQGKTMDEVIECYKQIEPLVDKVAFNFSYPFYKDSKGKNELHSKMNGRIEFIEYLHKNDIVNKNKPHHLLGCNLPQEFIVYKDYNWIDSLDTSNPVMVGMDKDSYNSWGIDYKPETKLFTIIDDDVTLLQQSHIIENIKKFREWCND